MVQIRGFGHMNQQDCSNFFATTTVLDLPSDSHFEFATNYIFPFLDVLSCRGVLNWPRKRTVNVLIKVVICTSSTSTHPHKVKTGVAHSSMSRADVVCQDQKDFNNEIKNIRHDLMFGEYPQDFFDSVMKPSGNSRPSSDKIYQGSLRKFV
jgi:hypothetical protein